MTKFKFTPGENYDEQEHDVKTDNENELGELSKESMRSMFGSFKISNIFNKPIEEKKEENLLSEENELGELSRDNMKKLFMSMSVSHQENEEKESINSETSSLINVPVGEEAVEDPSGQLPADVMRRMFKKIDMSSFQYTELDMESDEDDEREAIEFKEDSGRSSSSRSSENKNENYLTYNEFKKMAPFREEKTIDFVKSTSHTASIFKRIGDPTQFVINKYLLTDEKIMTYSVKEKLGILYKLKQLLILCRHITDLELLDTVVICNKILKSLDFREEWTLGEDIVLKKDRNGNFNLFVKCDDVLPLDMITKIKEKGGFQEFNTVNSCVSTYVPISKSKRDNYFEVYSSSSNTADDISFDVINKCYHRMFYQPLKRAGFILQMLEEL